MKVAAGVQDGEGGLEVSNFPSLSGYHLAFSKNEHIQRDIAVCAVQKHRCSSRIRLLPRLLEEPEPAPGLR
jgi:hypothetical protein